MSQHEPPHEPRAPRAPDARQDAAPPGTRAMAWLRWLLIVVLGLVALSSLIHALRSGTGAPASAAAVQYYCPMHPQIVQDHPGDCPICNMTLVERRITPAGAEREHGMGSSGPLLELSAERVQKIGVRVAPARLEPLEPEPELVAVAVVSVDETRLARVHSRFSGWIAALGANTVGREVARGEVLAQLVNVDLSTAQQEFLAARAWQSQAEQGGAAGAESGAPASSIAGDARDRLELFGLSEADIAAISRARKPARTLPVRSPIGGHVLRRAAARGAYVEPGTELFEIADLSAVWVLADVYERDVARLHPGQAARVELDAYPGERFEGTLGVLYPELDPATRALRARIELPNPGTKLRPGMFARVHIQLDPIQGIRIPAEALVDTGESEYVFVAREAGRFEQRRVRSGARAGDDVQIVEGLAAGELVVTTGNFLLDSESRLRAAVGESPGH